MFVDLIAHKTLRNSVYILYINIKAIFFGTSYCISYGSPEKHNQ